VFDRFEVVEIEASVGNALGIEVDVRDHEAVEAMVARGAQEWGRIDVLVAMQAAVAVGPWNTKALKPRGGIWRIKPKKGRALPGPVSLEQIPALAERGRIRLQHYFAWLDARLADNEFVCGPHVTMADISGMVAVDFSAWAKLRPSEHLGDLQRWHKDVSTRPSAKAWLLVTSIVGTLDDLVGIGGPAEGLGDVVALCDKALHHRLEIEERVEPNAPCLRC